MKQAKLDIFLPVYNEAGGLKKRALALKGFIRKSVTKKNGLSVRIVFVDDNSSDSTLEELKRLKRDIGISYVRSPEGPSRRENLARAMASSSADILMFMDSDLATDLGHIKTLIDLLRAGNHVVTGSRYVSGSMLRREPSRWVISKAYNWFMRLFFGSRIRDHQCGFKAFSRKEFMKLYQEMGYDRSFSRGWFWDAELLIRAQKKGFAVREVPVTWSAADQSSFCVVHEMRMIPYMVRFWLKTVLA